MRRGGHRRVVGLLYAHRARVIPFGPVMKGLDPVAAEVNYPRAMFACFARRSGTGRCGKTEQENEKKLAHRVRIAHREREEI